MSTLYTTDADGDGPVSTSDGLVLWNTPPPSALISQAVSVSESPWTLYWANNGTPAETTTFSFWWIPESATAAAAAASSPTLAPSQASQIAAATGTTIESSTASAYPTSTGATPSRSHAVAAAASSSHPSSSTPTPYMPSAAQQSADLANEKSDTPMIIGAVLGTVIFFALLGCAAWFLFRRHRRGALLRRRANGEAGLGGSSNNSQIEKGYSRKLSTTSTSTTTYVTSSPSSPSSGSEGAQSPSRPREVDLVGVIERTTRSSHTEHDPFDDEDRSTTPTPTSIQMRTIPSALLAPSSVPLELRRSDSGRPESVWTDDSEFDVMAIDGSSFTRTLSTVSSSNSTLVPEDGGTIYATTPSIHEVGHHPGCTYLSSVTSSAAATSGRPSLFNIDTATTFNPWPARPVSGHMSSIGSSIPTPPYSSSPVDSYNTHGSHSSASRSGSGPSATSSPTVRSSRSPITPVTRRNPFADSFRPRQSLESIHSEVPPAYTELYREDGSRV